MVSLDDLKMTDEVRECLEEEKSAKSGSHWRVCAGGFRGCLAEHDLDYGHHPFS